MALPLLNIISMLNILSTRLVSGIFSGDLRRRVRTVLRAEALSSYQLLFEYTMNYRFLGYVGQKSFSSRIFVRAD
jgi:hypothetical protein